ncbi:hypothetical protein RRG08_008364 [Elysia crispata]|uniref:Uncharacterized protein n=1 Tax=Elysia crispata TaxID=231223 RepID=A0AAE0Z4B2_9GAST|nr:hypothetical protein RRG08_008364 [Elysia crispata]
MVVSRSGRWLTALEPDYANWFDCLINFCLIKVTSLSGYHQTTSLVHGNSFSRQLSDVDRGEKLPQNDGVRERLGHVFALATRPTCNTGPGDFHLDLIYEL